MTNSEMSDVLDTLLSSYQTQANFGEGASKTEITLDEYEKSVLLTQAQDYIVKSFFDRTLNYQGQGMDDSTRRQMDFSTLISIGIATKFSDSEDTSAEAYDARGLLYKMPSDVLFILNEKLEVALSYDDKKNVTAKKNYVVIPINYKEYDRLMSKSYTQPLKKQAWRLFQNDSNDDTIAELVPDANIKSEDVIAYKLRYIKRPSPIVLVDLKPDGLSVDGVTEVSECTLNPILHMDIVNKAFDLAITSRGTYADALKRHQEEQQNKS